MLLSHYSALQRCTKRLFSSKANFEAKLKLAQSLPPIKDNAMKLKLYGFYKQATETQIESSNTDATTKTKAAAAPGMFDFVGKAKLEAWKAVKELTPDQARVEYVKIIDAMVLEQEAVSKPNTGSPEKKKVETAATASPEETTDVEIELSKTGLLTIKLNRPKKYNALNWNMYRTIDKALTEHRDNPETRAVLLCSTGNVFCSGNDLSMFTNIPKEGGPEKLASDGAKLLKNFVNAFISFPKPIVAAVQGPAIGIPVTILALCDLVYASQKATFQTPFATLGQSPEACSSALFREIMGSARANAFLLMGETFSSQRAQEVGLVTEVFGADFKMQVETKLAKLVSLPPLALRASKQLCRQDQITRLKAINKSECDLLKKLWIADECLEAVMKFATRKK